jgi:hypothetical protein
MNHNNFQSLYREAYTRLGRQLTPQDGIPEAVLTAGERKLGGRLPNSLRDYYLVAGREKVLNHAFNRILAPDDWEIHAGKFPFMVENQYVVVWGIDISATPGVDAVVFQGPIVKGEPRQWFEEHKRCTTFLVFMLHLQAAYGGGLAYSASTPAPASLISALDANWQFVGEVNGMRAYGRQGQAACFLKWPDLIKKTDGWLLCAGASTKSGLDAIAADLGLDWENQRPESKQRPDQK